MRLLAALRRSIHDGDLSPWAPHALAALFACGGGLVAASCALPGRTTPQLAIGASLVAVATAVGLMLLAAKVTARQIDVLLGLGSLLIGLVIVSSGDPASPDALMFVWVGLYAAFFMSPGRLMSHLTVVVLLYIAVVIVLAGSDHEALQTAPQHMLMVVGVIAVATAWTALLRSLVATSLERQRVLARTDSLTRLANRTELRRLGDEMLSAAGGGGVAVLLIDLDDFKIINDGLGHHAGDELLRQAAGRLRRVAGAPNVVARLGGDEFAVLIPSACAVQAATLGARLVEALAEPYELDGEFAVIDASIGVTVSDGERDLDAMLRDADLAMYAAKADGGGCRRFGVDMRQTAADDHELRRDLRAALATDDQLVVHFQPIVDLRDDRSIGAEALVRWQHPTRGLLPPAAFIPMAERTGLIVAVGGRVLDMALAEAARWPTDPTPLVLGVNLSARELQSPGLTDAVRASLQAHRFPAERLVVELTETAVMADPDVSVARVCHLRQMGVSVAIDDFGTGHASLAYLRDLPVRALKLPRRFVAPLGCNPRDDALARGVIALADGLGLDVVAEGVETAEQLELLRSMGCGFAQGYLLGRPRPSEARELTAPSMATTSLRWPGSEASAACVQPSAGERSTA